ncbi:hypothetical protein [Pedobacter sp. Leaf216]|uniref:hypothetical protein n=1 Tax=Pedobacter sp. Leaf216 TaxID=1735684 RepID=UPI0012FA5418|nr:hypothetical protein [Pedobacter sp. Leaf216]
MNNICKNASLILMLFVCCAFGACKKEKEQANNNSFLPMQIGNLWYHNNENFTEITDTLRLNNKLFYKFYSLIGGDAEAISYLRIDEQNRLIESYPSAPAKSYLKADFNAKVGDKFFTTGAKDVNDNEVTVVQKTDSEMVFSFDIVYQENLKGHPYQVKYVKGVGFSGNWKKLIINGVVTQK